MNKLIFGISTILLSTSLCAQKAFNPQNARDGETVEYCHQHTKLEELRLNNPAAYQQVMADQAQLKLEAKNYVPQKSETVYTIPVVFHILHEGGSENISDQQIYDAVAIMNRDYRRLNADANNVHTDFAGMPTDVEIEFKLATKAPNGACFKGITRTLTSQTNDGNNQFSAAMNGNDVFQGTWPHNRYLNIIVAKNIGGAAGYTMYPSNWGGGSTNAIYVLHNYVGSIGTSSAYSSRTLTHEVGHWLNLPHTWGNSNNPGLASNCDTDDGIADTPNTRGVTSCNLNENFCGPRANVENYMDYSYCSKMFTPGQATQMRTALTSSVAGRNNLWTTSNLNLTGAIDNPPLCKADFSATKRVVCVGETVQFNDQSYNTVSGWSWNFTGGSPATSTIENPTVTYAAPGTYAVSLTASNGGNTQSETKTAYITVLPEGASLPFFEGFESFNTTAEVQSKWFINNPANNAGFELTSSAAHSGSKSLRLGNFGQPNNNLDEIESSTFDLSNETLGDVTLSYRVAYRKRNSNDNEYMRVYFSSTCGNVWVFRTSHNSNNMSSSTVVSSNWTPTSAADWKTYHIPFSTSAFNQYFVDNFRFKFAFESNGGNNFFIDDINIYNGPASDTPVLGIENVDNVSGISLFPNPNDGEVNVAFTLNQGQSVTLNVMDVSGKILKTAVINGKEGENVVMLNNSDFASGMYFIQINANSTNQTLQFIKK